ncbi:MAG: site-specific integrase [Gemmatimonadetes bacterium]|nr:site-specific integrase [Gemmatimonadota bacterium]
MPEPKPQARHIPFTSSRIQSMKWDGRRSDIRYDSHPKAPGSGFGIRIYPTGRKSYVLQYRAKERVGGSGVLLKTVRSKVHLKVLGNVETMSLSTAREIGLKLIQEVEIGIDPSEDRSLEGITLSEFLPIYLEVKRQEGWTKKYLYDLQRRVVNYLLPLFGDRPLTAIKRSQYHQVYLGISSGEKSISGRPAPVEANRLHANLGNIFKVAEIKGAIPEGYSYPTRLVKKKRENPRKRYLSDPELKRLYRALEDEPQSHALSIVQILCHQGMRKRELLELSWPDVHLDRVSGRECEPPHIFVGTTKNGDKMFSVLSPQTIQIFQHLASQRTSDEVVFPSPVIKGESVKDIRPQWKRIRAEADLGDFTLHDLRHCVGTWLGRLEKTELVISRTLNHRVKSVTEQYSLIPNETKEEAIKELADWLQAQVGPPILIGM